MITRSKLALFTATALTAFALNSILCRLALKPGLIDAGSFTALRLTSGALALLLLLRLRPGPKTRPRGGSFRGALALFLYAAPFSYAYVRLSTGMGALILFGCVQATMIGFDLVRGRRPHKGEWLGLSLALLGLAGLTLPGQSAPHLGAAGLMALAGVAWGAYSLLGRKSPAALLSTADNFVKSIAFVPLVVLIVAADHLKLTVLGAGLALVSGAVTSGLGYAIWYRALGGLPPTRAALLQLGVPVLAALGGVALLGETISLRLVLCSALILFGVALAIVLPRRALPAV